MTCVGLFIHRQSIEMITQWQHHVLVLHVAAVDIIFTLRCKLTVLSILSNPPPVLKAITDKFIDTNCGHFLAIYTDGSITPGVRRRLPL